jgi:hypothetical protein
MLYLILNFAFVITYEVTSNVDSARIVYAVHVFMDFLLMIYCLIIFRARKWPGLFSLTVSREVTAIDLQDPFANIPSILNLQDPVNVALIP